MADTVLATDQSAVLQAVVARLISQMGNVGFNASTCFLAPEPEIYDASHAHAVCCTVCPSNSQFNQAALEGGGQNSCEEQSGVIVTPHIACKLDRSGEITTALTKSTNGLLVLKKRILKALTGQNLASGSDWLLTGLMHPLSCSAPQHGGKSNMLYLSLTFDTDFYWDLS